MMKTMIRCSVIGAFIFMVGSVQSTELVFQFTNPSFGGNPMYGSYLMNKAQSQNDKKARSSSSSSIDTDDTLSDFTESIERQVLNRLSRDIVNRIFGDGLIEEGSFEVGGFLIDVTEDLDSVNLKIVDIETGNQTSINLPFF